MPNAQQLRAQIEATLAERIPSALTPMPRTARPVASTGVAALDLLLRGGFPVGAITELVGPECSGRTSLALAFVARMTQAARVCAWVDVSDALHPESAAAVGVDLSRLLWTRCGISPATAMPRQSPVRSLPISEKTPKLKPGLPQGGSGHPRMEANGLSAAVSDLLGATAARCAEPQHMPRPERPVFPPPDAQPRQVADQPRKKSPRSASWSRLEQALRVTDLLLQAGGFSCIVLDMGSLQAEYVLRVPLATWFRFRAAAERSQLHVLLLTQHACSKSSAGLVVRMEPDSVLSREATVFTGLAHRAALERQRFAADAQNVLPIRKPPQSTHGSQWQSTAAWAGRW
jgi:recombination protein RecA